jgi:RNA 3'-terminal phosphate cyclase (ATP)
METDDKRMIEIDGSYGEGGGQILRTALALSAIFKIPIIVHQIRSGRKKPGLQPQHLRGVEALARMTEAQTVGVKMGSESITFVPKRVLPGEYRIEVGTAGSVSLLLQTLLPPLCLAQESSRLTLVGGTHVPWSPPFHYLSEIFLPTLRSMGVWVEARIEKWGWYPKGGGVIQVDIKPNPEVKPISLLTRGSLKRIRGLSATSKLPKHVAERQRDEALKRIEKEMKQEAEISVLHDVPAIGAGSFFFLAAESEGVVAGFSSLGKKGKRAEEVAGEVVDFLRDYLASDGCIDPYLADQLIPFMALIKGQSSFTTTQVTKHLFTNLWVIRHFIDRKISILGERGGKGRVDFFNE